MISKSLYSNPSMSCAAKTKERKHGKLTNGCLGKVDGRDVRGLTVTGPAPLRSLMVSIGNGRGARVWQDRTRCASCETALFFFFSFRAQETPRPSYQLLLQRVPMVEVDVRVADHVHEVAGLEAAHLHRDGPSTRGAVRHAQRKTSLEPHAPGQRRAVTARTNQGGCLRRCHRARASSVG